MSKAGSLVLKTFTAHQVGSLCASQLWKALLKKMRGQSRKVRLGGIKNGLGEAGKSFLEEVTFKP